MVITLLKSSWWELTGSVFVRYPSSVNIFL